MGTDERVDASESGRLEQPAAPSRWSPWRFRQRSWVTDENRKWWVVLATGLAMVLVTVDFNGITVALPTIGRDLDTSTTGLQWTVNAYLLSFAASMVAFGRLADIFGRRKVLLLGIGIFTSASALCGFAQTDWWLISARIVQGVGAAGFFAASLPIVSNAFPSEERARGIAMWAAVSGVGLAIGPLVGGFLTESLSWRWFFFFNVPVAVITVILTLAVVSESRDDSVADHVDIPGLVTVTAGLAALVLGIQQSDTFGWTSPIVIGALVAAAILLGLFAAIEFRVRDPLIDLELFADRSYLGANTVGFTANFGCGALLFFLTLYLQNVLGYSPLNAGLVFLAFTVPLVIFETKSSAISAWIGSRRSMAGGMTLMAASFALLALLSPTSGLTFVVVALAIQGVGLGVAYSVSSTAGMDAVPDAKAGAASGILGMIRILGVVFGVAIGGALFKALESRRLASLLADAGAGLGASERTEIRGLLSGSSAAEAKVRQLSPEVAGQVEEIVREAFVYGFDGAMVLCAIVAIVGIAGALLVAEDDPESERSDSD
ncbi:MFS transporter [Halosolutus gelatinilyticus]|uniref:MFS transporter n=1 Tax=Halosolutus gelatinilyticus TaxID=2931975 RepID=UPI001FF2B2A7|nr:MFS transporter [Halosolutus gelatinilyticus]